MIYVIVQTESFPLSCRLLAEVGFDVPILRSMIAQTWENSKIRENMNYRIIVKSGAGSEKKSFLYLNNIMLYCCIDHMCHKATTNSVVTTACGPPGFGIHDEAYILG